MNDAACEQVSHPSLGLCKHRQKALAGETVQEAVGQVKRSLKGEETVRRSCRVLRLASGLGVYVLSPSGIRNVEGGGMQDT